MLDFFEIMKLDPLAFGKYIFPHHFRLKSPTFHYKLLKAAQDNLNLVVGAPRASSKTTILGFLYPIHQISFKQKHFIVILTSVYTKSCGVLDAMKKEIRDNEDLSQLFPMEITKDAEGDSIIRHQDGFETRILCKGRDQIGDIRGEKFGAYRPDLIIIDDVEDDKMVINPERRMELQDNFDQVVLFLGERGVTQTIVIGTVLHDDSMLAKLLDPEKYKEFKKILYRGRNYDDQGTKFSLWTEKWTVNDLDEMEKKDPVSFAKEIQNDPVSGMINKFDRKDFRYWKIDNMNYVLFGTEGEVLARGELSRCKAAIACDLAWEEKRESDDSVIIPGFLTPNSEILVDTYFCKKGMRPNEIEEILFTMENRLRLVTGSSVFIGFEKAKLEKVMKWLLKEAMRKRNHYLLFKDLLWDADKITRIVTRLQPRYAQHVIYHRSGMGELEHQLLRVPSGTHEDLADGLQGLVQLLEYPRQFKKPEGPEAEFDWWRRKAIELKNPPKKHFVFGNKFHRVEIKATESFR
jgi:hypothetical protein